MAKKKWSPCAPLWSQERNLAAPPFPRLGPTWDPSNPQKWSRGGSKGPQGLLPTDIQNYQHIAEYLSNVWFWEGCCRPGCPTIWEPAATHRSAFPRLNTKTNSHRPKIHLLPFCPHISLQNSFMLCTLPNIGQCFIHRSTFLPCRTHWNRYSLLSSFRETSYKGIHRKQGRLNGLSTRSWDEQDVHHVHMMGRQQQVREQEPDKHCRKAQVAWSSKHM